MIQNETLHYAIETCSLGYALIARSRAGVTDVLLGDEPAALLAELRVRHPSADPQPRRPDEDALKIVSAIDGAEAESAAFDAMNHIVIDIRGTALQREVWLMLRTVRPGTTVTYAELASMLGRPRAARAVAQACAANNVAYVIPCHRVIRTDGAISGYRWGVTRKRALLERELRAVAG